MGKDYYNILGVSKGADEAELKKGAPQPGAAHACSDASSIVLPAASASCIQCTTAAVQQLHLTYNASFACVLAAYRKLAMKWHPVSQ
jgi:DnaJ-class molecular chaperone